MSQLLELHRGAPASLQVGSGVTTSVWIFLSLVCFWDLTGCPHSGDWGVSGMLMRGCAICALIYWNVSTRQAGLIGVTGIDSDGALCCLMLQQISSDPASCSLTETATPNPGALKPLAAPSCSSKAIPLFPFRIRITKSNNPQFAHL